MKIAAALAPFLLLLTRAGAAETPEALWKGTPPGEIPALKTGENPQGHESTPGHLTGVAEPTLTWFRPAKPDGRALIVCPGGGYNILAYKKEGTEVAKRLARNGLTVVVLNYRVPVKNRDVADAAPRLDLAEALRQVRTALTAQGFAKPSVGALGFSAGGHLVVEAAYGPVPEGTPRPDFVVPVYPAYLVDKAGKLKEEFKVTKTSAPLCAIHAANDPYPAFGSAQLWNLAHTAGVNSELHIYAEGGHGFGISESTRGKPVEHWPDVVEAWMNSLPKAL